MTAWDEIAQKVSNRIKNGITKLLVIRQLRLRQRVIRKSTSESKSKKRRKEIYPEELIAIIASILIIMIAYGGLGLALNVIS